MVEDKKEDSAGSTDESDTPTISVEEIEVKGLDANRYATKKTVAQGMLDIALLTSNASQLKYVLQVGPKHEFYTLLVVLISISIVLQKATGMGAEVLLESAADWVHLALEVNYLHDHRSRAVLHTSAGSPEIPRVIPAVEPQLGREAVRCGDTVNSFNVLLVGLLFVIIGGLDLNDHDDQPSALVLNDVIVIFIFVISVINIVISAFGIEYSNNPLILERLNYINSEYLRKANITASAGILAIVMTFLDVDYSDRQKKIAYWLYHASVGMMTGVVFCDVVSAIVAVVLGSIFNINRQPDHRRAEILNDTTLIFKIISISINVIIIKNSSGRRIGIQHDDAYEANISNNRTTRYFFARFRFGNFDLRNEPRDRPKTLFENYEIKAIVEAHMILSLQLN
ncbi:unnamed protein product [Chilo suppressalis]|uniref:Uncharacterized protein n=1 Tax=Chilo suppressalis TaxID=168631 RepID=A0ABN8B128_CHISP|nr:unnamed protein product [Chilo suppressalis]